MEKKYVFLNAGLIRRPVSMKNYETLTEAISDLNKRGYTLNFNLNDDCIECAEPNIRLHPEEFEIDEIHRFQQMSDVDDETILYAISSPKHGLKGLLVNAFGIYADSLSADLASKLAQKTV